MQELIIQQNKKKRKRKENQLNKKISENIFYFLNVYAKYIQLKMKRKLLHLFNNFEKDV